MSNDLTAPTAGPAPGGATAHQHGGDATGAGSALHEPGSFDLADHPVPTGREELWRFTPLKRLRGLHDGPADSADPTGAGASSGAVGKVLVDVDAAPEVRVETVDRTDPRLGSVYPPGDRISARAWNGFSQATVITVPKEVQTSKPTVVSVRGEDISGEAFGHTFIDIEPLAEAVLVLDHVGSAVYAENVEIRVGAGAQLTMVSVQDWADDAVHAAHQTIQVGRDAKVRHLVVSFGGDLVRLQAQVEYADPGGEAELLGLYFVDAGQHLEHRLFVDHNQPHTKSNVEYRGALQGAGAQAVWIGDVLIRKAAEGIETYENNRNLVLTDGCIAHSVPNLEIETGEIEGAGHASATGRFDDEQLFYLQSRGVPADEARRLVVHGFFSDLIRRIRVPELQDRLLGAVEAELEHGMSLSPASASSGSNTLNSQQKGTQQEGTQQQGTQHEVGAT